MAFMIFNTCFPRETEGKRIEKGAGAEGAKLDSCFTDASCYTEVDGYLATNSFWGRIYSAPHPYPQRYFL